MAFIDIEDPVKREQIVQDYIKNLKEIREKKENEKVRGITQRRDIEKVFQPVVQATEKSTSQITNELKNLKEEPKNDKPISEALDYYLNQLDKGKVDQYFGIYEKNGIYMMGEKEIKVDKDDNIFVDEASFKGTRGLWRLIMMKKPTVFDPEDLRDYQELLMITNVLDNPHITNSSNRPKNTTKYKFLTTNFQPADDQDDDKEVESGEDKSDDENTSEEEAWGEKNEKKGTGIVFLPGDINGLIEQLHLLLAEFRAGNKSATRNQIVAILDQLLKRNYLTQDEYNGVCRSILC